MSSQCQPKKKKKKPERPTQEKKKKVKRWSKVAAMGPLCVFNYNIAIRGVRNAVQCSFGPFLAPHFAMWFS